MGAGKTGHTQAKDWSWNPTSLHIKIQNLIKDLSDFGLNNGFLDVIPKVPATQGKIIINCHHQNLTFLLLKTPSSEKASNKMKKKNCIKKHEMRLVLE